MSHSGLPNSSRKEPMSGEAMKTSPRHVGDQQGDSIGPIRLDGAHQDEHSRRVLQVTAAGDRSGRPRRMLPGKHTFHNCRI